MERVLAHQRRVWRNGLIVLEYANARFGLRNECRRGASATYTRRRCIRRCPAAWTPCERWLRSERSSADRFGDHSRRLVELGWGAHAVRAAHDVGLRPHSDGRRLRPPVRARSSPGSRIFTPETTSAFQLGADLSLWSIGGSTWVSPRVSRANVRRDSSGSGHDAAPSPSRRRTRASSRTRAMEGEITARLGATSPVGG